MERHERFGQQVTNVIQRGRLPDSVGSVEEDDEIGAVQVGLLSAA